MIDISSRTIKDLVSTTVYIIDTESMEIVAGTICGWLLADTNQFVFLKLSEVAFRKVLLSDCFMTTDEVKAAFRLKLGL